MDVSIARGVRVGTALYHRLDVVVTALEGVTSLENVIPCKSSIDLATFNSTNSKVVTVTVFGKRSVAPPPGKIVIDPCARPH